MGEREQPNLNSHKKPRALRRALPSGFLFLEECKGRNVLYREAGMMEEGLATKDRTRGMREAREARRAREWTEEGEGER